jgi:hypothetical protein
VTHLGNLVGVLIDDELGGDAYDHAIVHLDECAQCRRDVAQQRWVKAQLAHAQPATAPDPMLLMRLLQIPGSEAVVPEAQSPRLLSQSRSRRLLGRTAPSRPVRTATSRPLRTGQPAGRRVRTRSVAAAGFAASVVVGFSGAISGSAAVPTGVGAATSAFPAVDLGAPISAVVPRPGARTAVSVVYRRP